MSRFRFIAVAVLVSLVGAAAFAQVAQTPPDDTPKFNIGATIYADYTYQESPKMTDADKNSVNFCRST